MKNIDKVIKENLEIKFTYVDLFYAFCKAKGIDDPEGVDSDEEYEELEDEFNNKITSRDLRDLGESIMTEGIERINNAMGIVVNR